MDRFIWEDQAKLIDYTAKDGRHLRIEGLSSQVSVDAVEAAARGTAEGLAKGAAP